jgi:hypothetical protein
MRPRRESRGGRRLDLLVHQDPAVAAGASEVLVRAQSEGRQFVAADSGGSIWARSTAGRSRLWGNREQLRLA